MIYTLFQNKLLSFLLVIITFFIASCEHSRVKFDKPTNIPKVTEAKLPKECEPPVKNKPKCKEAQDKQAADIERQKKEEDATANNPHKGSEIVLRQDFFLFGLYPQNYKIKINPKTLCPNGIQEIDQYYSIWDSVLGQISFGIYFPRTMKITCF